jgi:hypothetical protein
MISLRKHLESAYYVHKSVVGFQPINVLKSFDVVYCLDHCVYNDFSNKQYMIKFRKVYKLDISHVTQVGNCWST